MPWVQKLELILMPCFFRQRSRFDLEAFEENSAIIPREQLYQMYVKATSRDHGFLYCNLMESDPAKMFYASFKSRLVPGIQNRSKKKDEAEIEDT